jgi:hypothetical protein
VITLIRSIGGIPTGADSGPLHCHRVGYIRRQESDAPRGRIGTIGSGMSSGTTPMNQHDIWKKLAEHRRKFDPLHLRALFGDDPERGERLALDAVGHYLDYSKNLITDETLFVESWNELLQCIDAKRNAMKTA